MRYRIQERRLGWPHSRAEWGVEAFVEVPPIIHFLLGLLAYYVICYWVAGVDAKQSRSLERLKFKTGVSNMLRRENRETKLQYSSRLRLF